ncbi:hypothetical protein NPIL_404701 [Nephila pilipes]|uniref:Zinc finger CCHC-type and RNA-binding motif-containing protein 1 n=1 Tax=Nephila pilipes TaxID=299642 RepID=A0A8X6QZG2_NEPPI|nr:hypothetical protein NPIL_404701 [Nephila pilipes]
MSGGFCPSKSTVYIANLPFTLTNNDLHKILEKYGRVVKVTNVKDRDTHRSKGVAFVLFIDKESAQKCVRAMNQRELFGRTIKCSIAKDNGRTTEFIKRKYYKDKSRCYECGEAGHLSYCCPKNMLGDRKVEKKEKKKRKYHNEEDEEYHDSDEESQEEQEEPDLESLSAAIKFQQEKMEEEEYRLKVATGEYGACSSSTLSKKKIYKKSEYFSDEEEVEDT